MSAPLGGLTASTTATPEHTAGLDAPLGHAVFHEDSHADYGADVYQGPGRGCIDAIIASHDHLTTHSHQISNILIALDGGDPCTRAGSEAYMTGTMWFERDGKPFQIFVRARYLDAWEKRDGRWRIAHRTGVHDWEHWQQVDARGFMRDVAEVPEEGPFSPEWIQKHMPFPAAR